MLGIGFALAIASVRGAGQYFTAEQYGKQYNVESTKSPGKYLALNGNGPVLSPQPGKVSFSQAEGNQQTGMKLFIGGKPICDDGTKVTVCGPNDTQTVYGVKEKLNGHRIKRVDTDGFLGMGKKSLCIVDNGDTISVESCTDEGVGQIWTFKMACVGGGSKMVPLPPFLASNPCGQNLVSPINNPFPYGWITPPMSGSPCDNSNNGMTGMPMQSPCDSSNNGMIGMPGMMPTQSPCDSNNGGMTGMPAMMQQSPCNSGSNGMTGMPMQSTTQSSPCDCNSGNGGNSGMTGMTGMPAMQQSPCDCNNSGNNGMTGMPATQSTTQGSPCDNCGNGGMTNVTEQQPAQQTQKTTTTPPCDNSSAGMYLIPQNATQSGGSSPCGCQSGAASPNGNAYSLLTAAGPSQIPGSTGECPCESGSGSSSGPQTQLYVLPQGSGGQSQSSTGASPCEQGSSPQMYMVAPGSGGQSPSGAPCDQGSAQPQVLVPTQQPQQVLVPTQQPQPGQQTSPGSQGGDCGSGAQGDCNEIPKIYVPGNVVQIISGGPMENSSADSGAQAACNNCERTRGPQMPFVQPSPSPSPFPSPSQGSSPCQEASGLPCNQSHASGPAPIVDVLGNTGQRCDCNSGSNGSTSTTQSGDPQRCVNCLNSMQGPLENARLMAENFKNRVDAEGLQLQQAMTIATNKCACNEEKNPQKTIADDTRKVMAEAQNLTNALVNSAGEMTNQVNMLEQKQAMNERIKNANRQMQQQAEQAKQQQQQAAINQQQQQAAMNATMARAAAEARKEQVKAAEAARQQQQAAESMRRQQAINAQQERMQRQSDCAVAQANQNMAEMKQQQAAGQAAIASQATNAMNCANSQLAAMNKGPCGCAQSGGPSGSSSSWSWSTSSVPPVTTTTQ